MPDVAPEPPAANSGRSRIDQLFRQFRQQRATAFMPFVTAGDPDLETTAAVLHALAGAGVRICEIGFPFSDPIADGPVIQASCNRALAAGTRVDGVFGMIRRVTAETGLLPVAMVSCSIVHRRGPALFVDQATAAGIAGLIVPDLPAHEAGELDDLCRAAGLALVQLATPNTPAGRVDGIAARCSGFLYWVSVSGTTGERIGLPPDTIQRIADLKGRLPLPVCAGFGIGSAEQARTLRGVADGVIVGTALVRQLESLAPGLAPSSPQLGSLADWARQFVEALS